MTAGFSVPRHWTLENSFQVASFALRQTPLRETAIPHRQGARRREGGAISFSWQSLQVAAVNPATVSICRFNPEPIRCNNHHKHVGLRWKGKDRAGATERRGLQRRAWSTHDAFHLPAQVMNSSLQLLNSRTRSRKLHVGNIGRVRKGLSLGLQLSKFVAVFPLLDAVGTQLLQSFVELSVLGGLDHAFGPVDPAPIILDVHSVDANICAVVANGQHFVTERYRA